MPLPGSILKRFTFPLTSGEYAPERRWQAPLKDTENPRAAVFSVLRSYPGSSSPFMWQAYFSAPLPIILAALSVPSASALPSQPSRLPIL